MYRMCDPPSEDQKRLQTPLLETSRLQLLPVEILQDVFESVPEDELGRLRLISRFFDELVKPLVFRRVKLSVHRYRIDGSPSFEDLLPVFWNWIRGSETVGAPAKALVKHITIHLDYDQPSKYYTNSALNDRKETDALSEVLLSFESLRGVSLQFGKGISLEMQDAILEAVASMKLLEEFKITFQGTTREAQLMFERVRRVVRNCTCLRRLDVDLGLFRGGYDSARFYIPFACALFEDTSDRCLSIKHLGLGGNWSVRDPGFFRKIRNLTSLEISVLGGENQDELLWPELRRERMALKRLKTRDWSTWPLLQYLASFRGLEELSISREPPESTETTALAQFFFASVLENHISSLQNLHIGSIYSGPWCLSYENAELLSQAPSLKHLAMGICRGKGHVPVTSFLKILSGLKTLYTLQCLTCYPESLRDAECGNAYMQYDDEIREIDRLDNVVPHSASPRYIWISYQAYKYVGADPETGNKPRYEEVREEERNIWSLFDET